MSGIPGILQVGRWVLWQAMAGYGRLWQAVAGTVWNSSSEEGAITSILNRSALLMSNAQCLLL